jgi:hypothetical protein
MERQSIEAVRSIALVAGNFAGSEQSFSIGMRVRRMPSRDMAGQPIARGAFVGARLRYLNPRPEFRLQRGTQRQGSGPGARASKPSKFLVAMVTGAARQAVQGS